MSATRPRRSRWHSPGYYTNRRRSRLLNDEPSLSRKCSHLVPVCHCRMSLVGPRQTRRSNALFQVRADPSPLTCCHLIQAPDCTMESLRACHGALHVSVFGVRCFLKTRWQRECLFLITPCSTPSTVFATLRQLPCSLLLLQYHCPQRCSSPFRNFWLSCLVSHATSPEPSLTGGTYVDQEDSCCLGDVNSYCTVKAHSLIAGGQIQITQVVSFRRSLPPPHHGQYQQHQRRALTSHPRLEGLVQLRGRTGKSYSTV